jgi:hypothetical protein
MRTLSTDTKRLLDKLYNLRSEDSSVLVGIENSKKEAEETLAKTTVQKEELQNKITVLTNEEELIQEQSSRLLEVLANINENDFSLILDKLNISFHPREMENKLNNSLPDLISKTANETNKAQEELINVEEIMDDASTKIEELAIRKDSAIANQQKLNEYFDLALNGNLNITRESISSLLEQFDFSEEEQKEAAKLLMFPEDALYDYDQETKGGKTMSDVFAEAKGFKEIKAEEPEEEKPKSELIDLMKKCGIDYLDYSTADLEKINDNVDEEVIKSNINYIKQNNIALDIFSDNVELLYDEELIRKIQRLFELGKSAIDVYLNPSVLKKYNYGQLEQVIVEFEKNGLDPKMVPLMAY